MDTEQNVLGTHLELCSGDPMTGYQRDGYCRDCPDDVDGVLLCAVMTEEFLTYTNRQGMDIMRPRPVDEEFTGLTPGDRWCVAVERWVEAYQAGFAPPVVLEATSERVLETIDKSVLLDHQYEGSVPR